MLKSSSQLLFTLRIRDIGSVSYSKNTTQDAELFTCMWGRPNFWYYFRYKKAGGNLVEILVRGAGHSVPSDQPDVAKFIMDAFIQEYK